MGRGLGSGFEVALDESGCAKDAFDARLVVLALMARNGGLAIEVLGGDLEAAKQEVSVRRGYPAEDDQAHDGLEGGLDSAAGVKVEVDVEEVGIYFVGELVGGALAAGGAGGGQVSAYSGRWKGQ